MNVTMCWTGLQGETINVGDVDMFTKRNQSTTHDVITQELKFCHLIWWAEGKLPTAQ
jgi:hypothetical protein